MSSVLLNLCILLLLGGVFKKWVAGSGRLSVLFRSSMSFLLFSYFCFQLLRRVLRSPSVTVDLFISLFRCIRFSFMCFEGICYASSHLTVLCLLGRQWLSQTSRKKTPEDLCDLDVGKEFWNTTAKAPTID